MLPHGTTEVVPFPFVLEILHNPEKLRAAAELPKSCQAPKRDPFCLTH